MSTLQKILVVYGTRPEAIKLAPVVRELAQQSDHFEVVVCSTGQHREMLRQVETLFDLHSDHDLDLMRPDQKLNELAGRGLLALESLFSELNPDWLLTQGDTTTAMVASLAAFHCGIKVGHVEAGLRSGDLQRPFPEEANRRIIDLISEVLFAPTQQSYDHLMAAGFSEDRVFLTGNTVIDALHWVSRSLPKESVENEVLVTVHRRESFGEPIREIFTALKDLARKFPDVRWIYPVHRNPNVLEPAHQLLGDLPNVQLLSPLPYDQMIRLMRRCRLVLTDSGGIQEEAPTFGKPVLVLRDTTERPEGIEAGIAQLVGSTRRHIVEEASRLLTDERAYRKMATAVNPYGDGKAARRIAEVLMTRGMHQNAGNAGQGASCPNTI